MPLPKITAPGPVILPLSKNVPESNCRVPPEATVHAPAQVEPQVAPPVKSNNAALACTVARLLNDTCTVLVPTPIVFSNVPRLLKVPVGPYRLASAARFHVAPALLFTTALSTRLRK